MAEELREILEMSKADGEDMIALSIHYRMLSVMYKIVAEYLTDTDGELFDRVPDYVGMSMMYLVIDDIEKLAEKFNEVSKLCLIV